MYITVSLLGLLLMMPRFAFVLPYVLFFGHYGIGKYYLEMRVKDKVIRYILKLLYYNVALVLIYLVARATLIDILDVLPIWAVILIAEAAFVLYDFVFTKVTGYYFNNIRRLLMKD